MFEKEKIHLPDAEIVYYPQFLRAEQSNFLFNSFYKQIAWQQDEIKMFGKVLPVPRLQAFYADDGLTYSYSGIHLKTNSWIEELVQLKDQIAAKTNYTFNSVLLNLYRTGKDSNGWHADDEKELGVNPVIASVSLGASRNFHFKNKNDKTQKHKMELVNGSLLIMAGATQHHWLHQISKTAKQVGPRINLTFRSIVV